MLVGLEHAIEYRLSQRPILVVGEKTIGVGNSELVEPNRQVCRRHGRHIDVKVGSGPCAWVGPRGMREVQTVADKDTVCTGR